MRRTTTAAVAVASTAALLLAATQPAAAQHGGRHPERVSGTYSTGAAHAWAKLPDTHVGDDHGQATDATVVIDPSQGRQQYRGIGFSLDETSVSNLWKLTPAERENAIRLLADPRTGAGLDRFRLTIGSPDLIEHLPFWSYDELPAGVSSDFGLRYFSIRRDLDLHIVQTARLILKYNPRATFFASAWSAPAWMKTNGKFLGEVALKPGSSTDHYQVGKLRDDCIDVFARYYVKYLRAYAEQGIPIDALTLLNEPGMDVVYPAMDISIDQQQKLAVAIKRETRAAGLHTDLYVHDFNFWDWRDPNSTTTKNYYRIMNDPAAREAADAIAFHPYWGDPTVMRDAYEQYGKPVHLTETSDLNPATVLDYFRLDASSYVLWAQTTDQDGGTLHWTDKRDNNVDWDQVAATTKWPDRLVKVNTNTKTFSVRDELYPLGQFTRYLSPSDRRVESSATAGGVSNVVYRDGPAYKAIIGNATATAASVRVILGGTSFVVSVPAGAFATYTWKNFAGNDHRNHAPVLAPVGPVNADQYATTTFRLTATDRDRDRLAFYATDLPDGVSLDARTGVVTVHPTTAGTQDLTFHVTDGSARASTTVQLNVVPHGAPIGEKVEAEAYVAQHGWTEGVNFVESNPATSGGKDVGWTAPGNWLQYRLEVASAGTYDLELRVANGTGAVAPNAVSFRDSSGNSLAVVSVPDTGGWGSYQSVHVPVTAAAGDQLVTVYCETGGFNLDYFRLS
ncbi:carbohydrate-binding protein [Actinoplanes sp. KI2]|uniref:carbohydrate-binding protein n=1 Tax=Actinoplanes sp. KI2 TaxID=2983315 RepID=UPI0021D5ECA9|nr:carbohydrate-binding protein [Actinoplanes sp. KI2]MCU7725144.1 carbohydrate-binding protein [Actinoplanes sp. KI2]